MELKIVGSSAPQAKPAAVTSVWLLFHRSMILCKQTTNWRYFILPRLLTYATTKISLFVSLVLSPPEPSKTDNFIQVEMP
jgi:hypothetical protein